MHYLDAELNSLFQRDQALWLYIQQASLDGVWFWDLENPENLYISPEYWHLIGIDPASQEHNPQAFINVVFAEDLPNIMDNLERHYADPSVKYEQIVRFKHINGSTVTVRCRGKAIRDENGKAIRMLGAHNDITEEIKRQQSLEDKRAQEQQLMAVIAHELRTPIATIAMLLEDVTKPEDLSPDQLKIMQQSVSQSLSVLGDLKNISQEAHQHQQRSFPTNLHMFVHSLHQQLNECVHGYNENIVFSLTSSETLSNLPLFNLNTQAIYQIVSNLVCNAAKHAQCQTITWHVDAQPTSEADRYQVYISVKDDGIGILECDADRIFDAFARGTNSVADGTGLGLSVARNLSEALGGELIYRKNLPTGCFFTFSFKCEVVVKIPVEPKIHDRLTGKTLLFVEDNETIQTISKTALERSGANVILANNGQEALSILQHNDAIDYIFTDIFMPKMNGYDLCQTLRDKKVNKPIIAVTASVLGKEVELAMASGADAVIEKPMSAQTVQNTLNQILQHEF